jgi:hypothetical protein
MSSELLQSLLRVPLELRRRDLLAVLKRPTRPIQPTELKAMVGLKEPMGRCSLCQLQLTSSVAPFLSNLKIGNLAGP